MFFGWNLLLKCVCVCVANMMHVVLVTSCHYFQGGCVDSTNQSLALLYMTLGQQDVSKVLLGPLSPYTWVFLSLLVSSPINRHERLIWCVKYHFTRNFKVLGEGSFPPNFASISFHRYIFSQTLILHSKSLWFEYCLALVSVQSGVSMDVGSTPASADCELSIFSYHGTGAVS